MEDISRKSFIGGAAGLAGMAATGLLNRTALASEKLDAAGGSGLEGTVVEGVQATVDDAAIQGFSSWALAGGNAGASSAVAFLPGEENRPTDEELTQMLQTANTYFMCHGLTGTHFIVVKDAAEQAEMMKFMGADGTGTVMVLVMADGVKNQEYHAAEYYPGTTADNGGNPEYWNMYYSVFEAGWASGYLNLAARELGYRTRVFGALNLTNLTLGEVAVWSAGNFDLIQQEGWDIEKFMQPKDGGAPFTHYCKILDQDLECEGNVTMLCAMLIGKIDEVDATSGATLAMDYKPKMRENFDFWD